MGRVIETIVVGTHEAWEGCTLDNLEASGNSLQLVSGQLTGTCIIDWDLSGITPMLEHLYQAWNAVEPENTTILIEYNLSYDSGGIWEGWQTDIELEDILLASDQTDPATFMVQTRITLTTTDGDYQPVMESISLDLYHADDLGGTIGTGTSLDAGLSILKTLQGTMSNLSLLQGTLALRKGLQGLMDTSSTLQGTLGLMPFTALRGSILTSSSIRGNLGYVNIPAGGSFMDYLTQDLDDTFFQQDEMAIRAVYNNTISLLLIPVDYDTTIQDPEAIGDLRDYEVRISELERPVVGDEVVIDSVTWYLWRILSGGAEFGTWRIRLSSATRRRV